MALLQISDFDNAVLDEDFIDTVKSSSNDTETSRLGNETYTRIGRLKLNGYVEATAGAAWVAGIEFTDYRQFLVYNDIVYVVREDTALPITTGATPDANYKELETGDVILQNDLSNKYNQENLHKFTDLTFKNQQDMEDLLNLEGLVVNAPLGSSLKVADSAGNYVSYVVIDAVDIQPGDITILLANGLYAKELQYELDPSVRNPLFSLDKDVDAMNFRKPSFYDVANPYGSFNAGTSRGTIGQDGFVYYLITNDSPVQTIVGFNTLNNSFKQIPINAASGNLTSSRGLVLGSDGRLYIPYRDASDGKVLAVNTETYEEEIISFTFAGDPKQNTLANGTLCDNGFIYYFPQDPSTGRMGVIKVDTINGLATFLDTNTVYANGTFRDGCLAPNGKIYLAPAEADQFLEYDPETDTFTAFGATTYVGAEDKYNEMRLGKDGKIYAMPYAENYIQQIDPLTTSVVDNQFSLVPNSSLGYPAITCTTVMGDGQFYFVVDGNDTFTYVFNIDTKTYEVYDYIENIGGSVYNITVDKYGKAVIAPSTFTNNVVVIENIKENDWTKSAYV